MVLSLTASNAKALPPVFGAPSGLWLALLCLTLTGPVSAASQLLLAASWQPAFCETRPSVRECRSQTANRFDASHFALHGLWPQPRNKAYCSVAPGVIRADKKRRWLALPKLKLSSDTREELARVMPGVASGLHRHEWVKHGSCYTTRGAEHYYRDSLGLMRELNASRVRDLFESHLGKHLTTSAIRSAFNASFGRGAGKRVRVQCKRVGKRVLITELQIALGMRAAKTAGKTRNGRRLIDGLARGRKLTSRCDGGVVDTAGLARRNR